ncbi:hemerythrin family protein [Rhodoferax sp.]|uniref:bacteriohemerythrin n=1 Tax=Rhodoferax sp. TaxID=50421 RepID=UPI002604355F|nr:hemerythrin family protein [Rhodoferax sp.]MDD2919347.1 hemerythrin family protein [Rhodoferax sp.]
MSPIKEFNVKANDDTDREHQVQLELLQKLCLALEAGATATTVHQIISDLIDYSEAHFMSEELLMRMKSYDDYEEHQDNHTHILEVLRDMASQNIAGEGALLKHKARDMLGFITQHIATRDKRLADHVRLGL